MDDGALDYRENEDQPFVGAAILGKDRDEPARSIKRPQVLLHLGGRCIAAGGDFHFLQNGRRGDRQIAFDLDGGDLLSLALCVRLAMSSEMRASSERLVGGVGGAFFLVRCLLLAVLHKVAIAHRGLRNVRRIVR